MKTLNTPLAIGALSQALISPCAWPVSAVSGVGGVGGEPCGRWAVGGGRCGRLAVRLQDGDGVPEVLALGPAVQVEERRAVLGRPFRAAHLLALHAELLAARSALAAGEDAVGARRAGRVQHWARRLQLQRRADGQRVSQEGKPHCARSARRLREMTLLLRWELDSGFLQHTQQ